MRVIPLTKGLVALIDDEDAPLVTGRKWYAHRSQSGWYARNQDGRMHRLLLGARPGEQVDHRNRNGLDNRRSNLRLANASLNAANRGPRPGYEFKGIRLTEQGRFQAQVTVNRKSTTLGTFSTPELAARAYDRAALLVFGEFARLNFPIRASAETPTTDRGAPVPGSAGLGVSAGAPRGSSAGLGDQSQ